MIDLRTTAALLAGLLFMALVAGCAPEVGSERWCKGMDEKSKGDWTLEETRDYARYCLLGNDEEE